MSNAKLAIFRSWQCENDLIRMQFSFQKTISESLNIQNKRTNEAKAGI